MSYWFESGVLEYLSFRLSAHLNYRTSDALVRYHGKLVAQAMKFVHQDLPMSTLSANDDAKSLLELGLRQWTGFGTPQDRSGAITAWITIVSFREDIPSSLKARAYSSLAKGWLDLVRGKSLTSPDIDRLYCAGKIANEAVSLGLISDAALVVAEAIEFAGFRPLGDDKHPVGSTERFGELTDLWKALDARNAELAEKKLKREVKLSKDPMGYFCAAKDCGITVTNKSTLRKCGGWCPQALKPAYCSKDCHKADWKRHKPFCRPDAIVSSVIPANSTDATAVSRRPKPPEDTSCEGFPLCAERTISVNLGRRFTFVLSSETMPPQTMRWIRDSLENGSGRLFVRWLR